MRPVMKRILLHGLPSLTDLLMGQSHFGRRGKSFKGGTELIDKLIFLMNEF